jgi:V8-like Glu-specific endopeptidase
MLKLIANNLKTMSFSRFNSLTNILAGTATVAAIVITLPAVTYAKTAQEVAEIAGPITVQINSSLGDGSGVIISKNGNSYTVLTVNHVVADREVKYSVRTDNGKDYPVIAIATLQTTEDEPDLAIVKFESPEEHPVATLGNSEQAVIGSQIYVFGYPSTGGLFGIEREPELSPGLVTSRPRSRPEGYTLRYQAVTWSGMSGGPVFDADGRVVGLHGQGEFGFAQTSSGDMAPIKTGFNAAVPINSFIRRLSDAGMNPEDLVLDDRPTVSTPLSTINPQKAEAYYFRALTNLDRGDGWEAIADFNRALQLNPNNAPEIYFNMGIARSLLVNPQEVTRGPSPIADYTKAIELNAGSDAYYNRANAYYQNSIAYARRGDLQTAYEQFEKAMADMNKAAELYQQGGRVEDYEDALKTMERLKESSPLAP